MAYDDFAQQQDDLLLKGFNLGEEGGGLQLITKYKWVDDSTCYVETWGNGPKVENDTESVAENENMQNNFVRQFLDRIPGLNKNSVKNKNSEEKNNLKLRYFKLTLIEKGNKTILPQEFVSPQTIEEAARVLGIIQ